MEGMAGDHDMSAMDMEMDHAAMGHSGDTMDLRRLTYEDLQALEHTGLGGGREKRGGVIR